MNETSQATAPNPVLSSLAAAFRHASVGMAVGTPEGELFDINPAFARMLGYERAELFELGLAVISAPGDAGIDVVQWERLVAGEIDAYQREKRYRRKDGTPLWGLVTVSALRDDDGQLAGGLIQVQDISAQRQAEAALRENTVQLETLVAQLPVALYRVEQGAAGDYLYVSPLFQALSGLGRADLPTTTAQLMERVHPDDRAAVHAANERAWDTGAPSEVEFRLASGDGRWVWLYHRAVVVREASDGPRVWQGVLLDISERKRLEGFLLESRERFRRAFEDAAIGMSLGSTDHVFLDVNDAYCRIVDRPRDALIGQPFAEVTHPDDVAAYIAQHARLYAGEIDSYQIEKRYVRPDGSIITGLLTVSAVRDGQGEIIYDIGQLQDVTAQRTAERAVRENEERLRALVDHLPAALYRQGMPSDGSTTYVSPSFATLLGVDPKDLPLGFSTFFARMHPDDQDAALASAMRADETGEPMDLEYRLRREDGEWTWVHDRSVLERNEAGQPCAWTGVLLNVSERKRLESSLRESEERLRTILEQVPAAVYCLEPGGGGFTYISPSFYTLTGLAADAEHLDLKSYFARVHPDDIAALRDADNRAGQTGQALDHQYRLRGFDGEWRWVHDHSMLTRDERGEPQAWYGVLLDISDRMRLEAALQENEVQLQLLVEQLPVALYGLEFGESDHYTYVSPRFGTLTGMSAAEVAQGVPALYARMHPDDRPSVMQADVEAIEKETVTELEYRLRNDAGEWVWIQDRALLARDEQGRPRAWHGVLLDVSERKRLEASVRESDERFRRAFEGAGTGMTISEIDGPLVDANPAFCRFTGYRRDELLGKSVVEITHPDDRELTIANIGRLRRGEIESASIEKRYLRADGRIVWGHLTSSAIRDADGRVRYTISQVQDITARKAAEAALRESEARFRSIFQGAGIGMALASPDGAILVANTALERMLGYDPGTLVDAKVDAITFPEDLPAQLRYRERLRRGEIDAYHIEKRYRRRDGAIVWAVVDVTSVRDDDGTLTATIAQIQDITARKEAEAALEDSDSRFRAVFEGAGVGMALVAPEGVIMVANPALERFLGYEHGALEGVRIDDITFPDDVDKQRHYRGQLRSAVIDSYHFEKRYRRRDGRVVWGLLNASPIRDEQGTLRAVVGQVQDISARKEAEAALWESEARFRSVFEGAGIGMVLSHPGGPIALANRAMGEYLGYTPEELVGMRIEDITHPDDSIRQREFSRRLRAGEIDSYQMEKRYLRRDGATVWGLLNVTTIRDETGTQRALVGQVQDITAWKEAEAAVRESEARFRALVQHDPDVIAVVDADRSIVYLSPSAEAAFGVPYTTLLGPIEQSLKIIHPDDAERVLALYAEVGTLPDGVATTEARFKHRKRGWRWHQVTVANLLTDPGVGGFLFNLRDITERKQAELAMVDALQAQQAANAELQQLNLSKSRFLSMISHEFRTPLTAIMGFSELLRSDVSDAAAITEDAAVIHREASRLNRMVDDVLLFDRLDAGRLPLNIESVDLNAIARNVVETFRPIATGHELILALDPLLDTIDADPDRMAQALTNLVGNAVKYSPGGGKITIATARDVDMVEVSVKDQGIGIAPENVSRIFDRFERVETGIAGRIAGTGLGLPIAREIAHLHHGELRVESTPGDGSTFYLRLPEHQPAFTTAPFQKRVSSPRSRR